MTKAGRPTPVGHDMLTLTQAAAIAGLQPDTLRQQIHHGRLAGHKLGRDWLVTRRELGRYMREQRRAGHQPRL